MKPIGTFFCLAVAALFLFSRENLCAGTVGVVFVAEVQKKDSTPAEVFDGMRKSFNADQARGVHARYQFKFTGPNGGDWWIVVSDGTFKMGRGTIEKPEVTFAATDRDWVALSNGTLGGTWAYLSGRLKITGDRSLAKKLDEIFP